MKLFWSTVGVILAFLLVVLMVISYIGLTGIGIYFFVNLFLHHFEWYVPLIWLGIDIVVVILLLVISFILGN